MKKSKNVNDNQVNNVALIDYNRDLLKSEEDIRNLKLYSHEQIKQKVALWKKNNF